MTLIGISDSFRSETCEKLKNIKGFNYFCAVENEDLKKHLFENFDYTFFPTCYDIELTIESDSLIGRTVQVYGTPDSDLVPMYNQHKKKENSLIITKMTTSFPSELSLENDTVLTYGGLILIKLGTNTLIDNHFRGVIKATYTTMSGKKQEKV